MITITGGKLTTWRRMAKMAVDRLVERDGRDAPCRTHEVPLGLAVEPAELPARARACPSAPTRRSPAATATPRTRCCGSPPSAAGWPQPVIDGLPDLLAEVVLRRPPRAGAHASATCSCAARGSGSWPRASCARAATARPTAWPRRWAPSSAGTAAPRPRGGRGVRGPRPTAEGIVGRPLASPPSPHRPVSCPRRCTPRLVVVPAASCPACSPSPSRRAGGLVTFARRRSTGRRDIRPSQDRSTSARDGDGGVVYLKPRAGSRSVFLDPMIDGAWQPPARLDALRPGASRRPRHRRDRRPDGRSSGSPPGTCLATVLPAAGAPPTAPLQLGSGAAEHRRRPTWAQRHGLPAVAAQTATCAPPGWTARRGRRWPRRWTSTSGADAGAGPAAGGRRSAGTRRGRRVDEGGADGRTHVSERRLNGLTLSSCPSGPARWRPSGARPPAARAPGRRRRADDSFAVVAVFQS